MATGLIAMLCDNAGLAKVTAASVDDVAANMTKASTMGTSAKIDNVA